MNLKWTAVLMTWKKLLLLLGGGDYYSFATVSSLHWNIKLGVQSFEVVRRAASDKWSQYRHRLPPLCQPRSFVHQPAFWAGALLQVCNRLLASQAQFWAFQDIFRCINQWYSVAGIMQVRGLFSHCYLSSYNKTRQSEQCGFSIYTFDNLKSKSMVRLVRAEKMVLSGLVFSRKIARMILNQNS